MDLFAFRKPKNELESDEGESKNVPFVPEEMWIKCPKCNTMLLTTDMEENLHVCTKCNHHFRMNGRDRVEMLADKDTFVEFDADLSSHNILDFPGYDEKLEKARKTGAKESVICGECKMNGIDAVLCVMDPTFMMGSMGVITAKKSPVRLNMQPKMQCRLLFVLPQAVQECRRASSRLCKWQKLPVR